MRSFIRVGSLWGMMAKVFDCNLKVSEFKFKSCCYVHFWTNSFGKGMNPLIPTPSYGLNSITVIFLQGQLRHWITCEIFKPNKENKQRKQIFHQILLIDWFQRYVNLSRVILCQAVGEWYSLYVHIYTFCVVVF